METNLHYNYYRDYDPSTGRYIQSDPIGLEGGLNTYGYAEGNPVLMTDPFGLRACVDPKGKPMKCPPNVCRTGACAAFSPNHNNACNVGCNDPIEITWTTGLPGARLTKPVTKKYSLDCLVTLGIVQVGATKLQTAVANKAKEKATEKGLGAAASLLGAYTSVPGAVISAVHSSKNVLRDCECKGK